MLKFSRLRIKPCSGMQYAYEHTASSPNEKDKKLSLSNKKMKDILKKNTFLRACLDKLGNICSSDNYRLIAISSLVFKIFDWVIILLYGDKQSISLQKWFRCNVCTMNILKAYCSKSL